MKTYTQTLSRRSFLKGAAAATIATPLFTSLSGDARAQGAAFPKRFLIFYSPNGKVMNNWGADGDEHNFVLKSSLSPLERHKESLIIMDGLQMQSCQKGPGSGHPLGMAHLLTGTAAQTASPDAHFVNGTNSPMGYAGGISIDQHIANHIGHHTPFRSLEFGVINTVSQVATRLNYAGPGLPIPPEARPDVMFNRLFGPSGLNRGDLVDLQRKRRSIIDFALGHFDRVAPRVGRDDQRKLAAHAEHLRGIEQAIAANGLCQGPELGPPVNINRSENIPALGKAQMDILVAALRCDLTRVATVQWICPAKEMVYSFLGHDQDHHSLSHQSLDNVAAQAQLTQIDTFFNTQLAYLIDQLKAVPEGDGSLFDNTVILVCSEVSHGRTHDKDNMPFMLAGSAGGALRAGRYLSSLHGRSHNDLLVSIMNAMGVDEQVFGDPDFCTGPIAELV